MASIKDTNAQELIQKVAEHLEEMPDFKPPEWASVVKTGVHKERPPVQKNWWYLRVAGILRHVYLNQSLGVSKIRKFYGGRKNRGHKPEHKYKGSGSIARKALQQLEKSGFVKIEKGKGRVITPDGRKLLNDALKEAKK